VRRKREGKRKGRTARADRSGRLDSSLLRNPFRRAFRIRDRRSSRIMPEQFEEHRKSAHPLSIGSPARFYVRQRDPCDSSSRCCFDRTMLSSSRLDAARSFNVCVLFSALSVSLFSSFPPFRRPVSLCRRHRRRYPTSTAEENPRSQETTPPSPPAGEGGREGGKVFSLGS